MRIHRFSQRPLTPPDQPYYQTCSVILTLSVKWIHPPEAVASEAAAHGSDLTLKVSGPMRR